MTKEQILTEINNDVAYQFDACDAGFEFLTRTRYTNKIVDNLYLCSFEGDKLFKISIEEIDIKDLPEKELKVFNEHLEMLEEE